MLPASPFLAAVLWSFLSSNVVALPVPVQEYDPFIHGLPGWKPWFGIGPVVRPILEHQAKSKKLADAKNNNVDDDDGAQADLSAPTPGIKGWNPLYGKGPVMFHRRPQSLISPSTASAVAQHIEPPPNADAILPYGLGP
ncbi:hypothetical protein AB1N83_009217 [Pleurotus pulmonarius]|nr:hypothetical protein EYR38_003036 [Pleurotus pulmonarius]